MKKPLDRLSFEILDLIHDYKYCTYRDITESLVDFSKTFSSFNSFKEGVVKKIIKLKEENLIEDYRDRIVMTEHGLRWFNYIFEPALSSLRKRDGGKRKRKLVVVA